MKNQLIVTALICTFFSIGEGYSLKNNSIKDDLLFFQEKNNTKFADEQDSLALVALYNSTNGSNWISNSNWLSGSVDTWEGVYLNEEGRVIGITLMENNLTGVLPSELGNLTELIWLNIPDNQLAGIIPVQIGNLIKLEYISLDNNNIQGSIPLSFENLINLTTIQLQNNNLTGDIFSSIGNLSSLTSLWLGSNSLSGEIPVSISQLTSLEYLDLSQNNLSGTIPQEIGNLTSLQLLNLGENALEGLIPSGIGDLSSLIELYLYGNNLSGTIPESIGTMTNLQYLWLDNNSFEGEIPTVVVNLDQLFSLGLSYNNFSSLVDLSNLNLFDLSIQGNNFTFADLRIGNIHNLDFNVSYSPQNSFVIDSTIIYGSIGGNVVIDLQLLSNGQLSDPNNKYLWIVNDEELGEFDTPILTIENFTNDNVGSYHCEITNSDFPNLVLTTSEVSVDVSPVGISRIQSLSICAYPNPASNILYLEKNDEVGKIIKIYNEFGMVIKTYIMDRSRIEIDVKSYPKGVYFIKSLDENVKNIQKVMIQ